MADQGADMDPTTSGRFRVHDRRPRPTDGDADPSAEFVLVELPETPVDPADPDADEAYDPLYATAEGYEGDLADRIDALDPGTVVDATLAWDDGSARVTELSVVRESRFRFADDVEGMFEAAVEAWQGIRADGEAMGSITTKSTDGEPNGALYLFADGPGTDTFDEVKTGRLPIEPLIERVNDRRADDAPREVFVLRPAAHDFVAVYVVFERDGVLARTVRDTYGLGEGLAAGIDESGGDDAENGGEETENGGEAGNDDDDTDDTNGEGDGEFDITDRL